MTPAEIREKAAGFIEKWGWYKSNGKPAVDTEEGQPVCLVEAIAYVDADLGAKGEALKQLLQELGAPRLVDWNDDPRRTKAEVIAALRGQS